jgi:hypothetical protein
MVTPEYISGMHQNGSVEGKSLRNEYAPEV